MSIDDEQPQYTRNNEGQGCSSPNSSMGQDYGRKMSHDAHSTRPPPPPPIYLYRNPRRRFSSRGTPSPTPPPETPGLSSGPSSSPSTHHFLNSSPFSFGRCDEPPWDVSSSHESNSKISISYSPRIRAASTEFDELPPLTADGSEFSEVYRNSMPSYDDQDDEPEPESAYRPARKERCEDEVLAAAEALLLFSGQSCKTSTQTNPVIPASPPRSSRHNSKHDLSHLLCYEPSSTFQPTSSLSFKEERMSTPPELPPPTPPSSASPPVSSTAVEGEPCTSQPDSDVGLIPIFPTDSNAVASTSTAAADPPPHDELMASPPGSPLHQAGSSSFESQQTSAIESQPADLPMPSTPVRAPHPQLKRLLSYTPCSSPKAPGSPSRRPNKKTRQESDSPHSSPEIHTIELPATSDMGDVFTTVDYVKASVAQPVSLPDLGQDSQTMSSPELSLSTSPNDKLEPTSESPRTPDPPEEIGSEAKASEDATACIEPVREPESPITDWSRSPTPPPVELPFAELQGHIISALALSRSSSLTASAIVKNMLVAQPSLKDLHTKKEWVGVVHQALKNSAHEKPVFGRIMRTGTDAASQKLEDQYYYNPENDPDQSRAEILKDMMPKKRGVTKQHRQYYFEPVGKVSRWDPEDDF